MANKQYSKTNWQNEPSTATPINAANLNKIENGIDAIDTLTADHEDRIAANTSALSNKVDKDGAKVLSTNDFTDADKTKLDGVPDNIATTDDIESKVFVATYGVTTAQQILSYVDGTHDPCAPILVKRGNDYYTVITTANMADNRVIIRTFATLSGVFYIFNYDITNGSWSNSNYGIQKVLVSGTDIKTINNQSILGSGNLDVSGGTSYDDTELRGRIGDVETALDGHTVGKDVPSDAVFTDTVYDDTALVNRIQSTETALTDKADKSSVPSKTSDLTNDSGFLTSIPSEYVTDADLENYATVDEHLMSVSYVFTMNEHEGTASGESFKSGTMVSAGILSGTWGNNSCSFTDGTNTATLTFDSGVYTLSDPNDLLTSPVEVQGMIPYKKLTDALVPDNVARKADLNSKADKTQIPTNVSQLANDAKYQTDTDVESSISGKADKTELPENVSELSNDAGYVTADYVDQKVASGVSGVAHITEVILGDGEDLPATGEAGKWYLKPNGTTYEIWAYYENTWHSLGMVNAVDLSGYLKTVDLPPVDSALSMTSTNAIENQAVAAAFHRLSNENVLKYEIAWDKDRKAITFTDNASGIVQELILTGVVVS